jgi:hypothetical protein
VESEFSPLAREVHERLAEAVAGRDWLVAAMDGHRVDPTGLTPDEVIEGLLALMGALVDSVNLLVAEFDRQSASR